MPCSNLKCSAIDSTGKLLVGGSRLFRYTPENDSWEILGLNNTPADILITPEENFYVGCDFIGGSPAGAYVSEDTCQTFIEINSGLNSTFIRDLALDQYGRLLAAAGRYLQRSYEPVTVRVKEVIKNKLSAYPNPFNHCVNLLLENSNTSANKSLLTIFDSFGNIIHQEQISTNYLQWCPENLSKGLYYILIHDGFRIKSTTLIYN